MLFSAIILALVSISAEAVQETPRIVNINGNIGKYIESKLNSNCESTPAVSCDSIKECETVTLPEIPVAEYPCVTSPVVEPPCVTSPVIVEPPCVAAPSQVVEKSPVEVLVVNVIPQQNQTQPPPSSPPTTTEGPVSSTEPPSSATPNPQPTVMVQQSVNLPNGQQGPINGPISGPFGRGCGGGWGFGRCGFFSPFAAALRARVAARFGARLGF